MLKIVNKRELTFPSIHFILRNPRHPEFLACRIALRNMIAKQLKDIYPTAKGWEISTVEFDLSGEVKAQFGNHNIATKLTAIRDGKLMEVQHVFGILKPTAFGAVLLREVDPTEVKHNEESTVVLDGIQSEEVKSYLAGA